MSRKGLGLTEQVILKLHPDLKSWLDAESDRRYCTVADLIRRLIIEAMKEGDAKETR